MTFTLFYQFYCLLTHKFWEMFRGGTFKLKALTNNLTGRVKQTESVQIKKRLESKVDRLDNHWRLGSILGIMSKFQIETFIGLQTLDFLSIFRTCKFLQVFNNETPAKTSHGIPHLESPVPISPLNGGFV